MIAVLCVLLLIVILGPLIIRAGAAAFVGVLVLAGIGLCYAQPWLLLLLVPVVLCAVPAIIRDQRQYRATLRRIEHSKARWRANAAERDRRAAQWGAKAGP